ncbi:MAG TPA: DUF167 domain-containing protein, partial [archaeon]|nr:DUF167 domain-containing protein [archaeon]
YRQNPLFEIINATVKTSQKKFSIVKGQIDAKGVFSGEWKISVRSAPENNKANIEIIKELSKMYKSVRIVSGLKSRKKVIEVL